MKKNNVAPAFIYLIFLFFSLGQLGRLSFLSQSINGYLYEIPLTLYILYLGSKYGAKPLTEAYRKFKYLFFFIGYLTVAFIFSLLDFTLIQNLTAGLYLIRLIGYGTFFLYSAYHIYHTRVSSPFRISVYLFSIITLITSFIQYFFYPELRNIQYLGWDPHLHRMVGLFFDPPVAGALYGLLILFLLRRKLSLVLLILQLFLFVCMILTFSRGTYLAFIITAVIYVLKEAHFKRKTIFIGVVLFIVALVIAPKPFGEGVNLLRTSTIDSRIGNYKEAFQVWLKKPVFGIGYNHIRYVREDNPAPSGDVSHSGASYHSSFLIILVAGGFVGLIFFLLMLRELMKISELTYYGILFTGFLSLTDNILLHPFILFVIFLYGAIGKSIHPSDTS